MPPKSMVTDAQRKTLRDYARKNPNIRQSGLRLWFVKKYGIDISQSFVSVVLSPKFRHLDPVSVQPPPFKKKPSRLKYPHFEEALYRLILKVHTTSKLTYIEIRNEARRLWEKMFPEKDPPMFSNGWLDGFKKRYSLSSLGFHAEKLTEVTEKLTEELTEERTTEKFPELKATIKRYSPTDVYTCAETVLYYTHTPDKKVDDLSEHKMTIHVCCNSNGTVKAPPWYIGNPQNNKFFNGKDLSALPYMFISNEKSYMTASIFQEWLAAFEQHAVIGKRKVLLILEDFRAHRTAVKALQDSNLLSNTEILFLPSGTAATTHAFNQGILRNFKAHFRSRWLDFIWQQSLLNRDFMNTLDILKVIDWCNYAWKEIPTRIIANCWNQTEISSSPGEPLSDPGLCEKLNFSISVLSGKGIIGSPVGSVDDFLLPSQEDILDIPDGDVSENIFPQNALPVLAVGFPKSGIKATTQLPRFKPSQINRSPSSLQHAPLNHHPLQHSSLQHHSLKYPPFQHPPFQHPPFQHPPFQHPPFQHPPFQHPPFQHPPFQHPPLPHHPSQHNTSQHPPLQHPSFNNGPLQHPPLQAPLLNQHPLHAVPPLQSPLLHALPPLRRPSLNSLSQEVTTPNLQLGVGIMGKESDSGDNGHAKEPLFLRRGKTLIQIDGAISYMEQEGNASLELLDSLKRYRSILIEQQGRDIRALSMGDLSILQSPCQQSRQTATPKSSFGGNEDCPTDQQVPKNTNIGTPS